jgi:hypothetical protein
MKKLMIIFCGVLLMSNLASAGLGDYVMGLLGIEQKVPEIHYREKHPEKFQEIKTEYVIFRMPTEATHYWDSKDGKSDTYEIILHDVEVDGQNHILRVTWKGDRNTQDLINIDYDFIKGELTEDKISIYSKLGKNTKFDKFKIETGTLIGQEKKEVIDEECLIQTNDEKKCKEIIVKDTYSWEKFKPIKTSIKEDFKAIDDVLVSNCGTISSPGDYYLNSNLTSLTDCLVITADNVNIEGNNHWVIFGDNASTSSAKGITVQADNFKVENLKMTTVDVGSRVGIYSLYNDGVTIDNVSLYSVKMGINSRDDNLILSNIYSEDSYWYAITVDGRNNPVLTNITSKDSLRWGIRLMNLVGANVTNVLINGSGSGSSVPAINLYRTNNNFFKNMTILNAQENGINIETTSAGNNGNNNYFEDVNISSSGWGLFIKTGATTSIGNIFHDGVLNNFDAVGTGNKELSRTFSWSGNVTNEDAEGIEAVLEITSYSGEEDMNVTSIRFQDADLLSEELQYPDFSGSSGSTNWDFSGDFNWFDTYGLYHYPLSGTPSQAGWANNTYFNPSADTYYKIELDIGGFPSNTDDYYLDVYLGGTLFERIQGGTGNYEIYAKTINTDGLKFYSPEGDYSNYILAIESGSIKEVNLTDEIVGLTNDYIIESYYYHSSSGTTHHTPYEVEIRNYYPNFLFLELPSIFQHFLAHEYCYYKWDNILTIPSGCVFQLNSGEEYEI